MNNERIPPSLPLKRMLDPYPTTPSITPWMTVAERELGVAEIPGEQNNERIIEYLETVLKSRLPKFLRDETPWCAAYLQWVLKQAGIAGTGKPNARSYLQWGVPTDAPHYGDVVIFKRGLLPWQGHVAFFVRFEGAPGKRMVRVLGGNQGSRVSRQARKITDVIGYRKVPV